MFWSLQVLVSNKSMGKSVLSKSSQVNSLDKFNFLPLGGSSGAARNVLLDGQWGAKYFSGGAFMFGYSLSLNDFL